MPKSRDCSSITPSRRPPAPLRYVSTLKPKPGESLQTHWTQGVTGDYFAVFGIPLREGRFLTTDDTAREERVCVIDESVARRYWGERSPLGGQLFNGAGGPGEVLAIMGLQARESIVARNLAIVRSNLALAEQWFGARGDAFEWLPPVAGPVAFPRLRLPPRPAALTRSRKPAARRPLPSRPRQAA